MREQEAWGIEFELQRVEPMPWSELNVLTQTRKVYQPEGLEELTRAIKAVDDSGEAQYKLFHPIMVNMLPPHDAAEYVADLNLCHGTSHQLEEFQAREDGGYVFVVAGHRRRLATGKLIAEAYRKAVVAPASDE